MPNVLFKNAALLDPLQPELLMGHDVLVEGDVIKEVSDRSIKATADRTIDLKGKTLMPGLIDLHVHTIAIELNSINCVPPELDTCITQYARCV